MTETPRSTAVEHAILGEVYEADTHNGYAQEWDGLRENGLSSIRASKST